MPLTTKNAGELIPRGIPKETSMAETVKIKAVRAFYYKKELKPVGDVFEVSKNEGMAFCATNKAVLYTEPQSPKKEAKDAK
jgi:hypothetical protein